MKTQPSSKLRSRSGSRPKCEPYKEPIKRCLCCGETKNSRIRYFSGGDSEQAHESRWCGSYNRSSLQPTFPNDVREGPAREVSYGSGLGDAGARKGVSVVFEKIKALFSWLRYNQPQLNKFNQRPHECHKVRPNTGLVEDKEIEKQGAELHVGSMKYFPKCYAHPSCVRRDNSNNRKICTSASQTVPHPPNSQEASIEVQRLQSINSESGINHDNNGGNDFRGTTLETCVPSCFARMSGALQDENDTEGVIGIPSWNLNAFTNIAGLGTSRSMALCKSSICVLNSPADRLVGLTMHCFMLSMLVIGMALARWLSVFLKFVIYLFLHSTVYRGLVVPLREDSGEPVTREQLRDATLFDSTGLRIVLLQYRATRQRSVTGNSSLDRTNTLDSQTYTTAATATTTTMTTPSYGRRTSTTYSNSKCMARERQVGRVGQVTRSISSHSGSSQDISHIFNSNTY